MHSIFDNLTQIFIHPHKFTRVDASWAFDATSPNGVASQLLQVGPVQ